MWEQISHELVVLITSVLIVQVNISADNQCVSLVAGKFDYILINSFTKFTQVISDCPK